MRSDIHEGQIAPPAKVNDVLSRNTQQLGNLTRSQEITTFGLVY